MKSKLQIIITAIILVSNASNAQEYIFHYDIPGLGHINHREEWLTDSAIASNSRFGYALDGYFIGPLPIGIDRDSLEGKFQFAEFVNFPIMLRGIGEKNDSLYFERNEPGKRGIVKAEVAGEPYEFYIANETHPYKGGKKINWVTLDEIRRSYFPEVKGTCVYTVNKFIIPNKEELYKFDADYILRLEKLESHTIEALKDFPPFTIIRVFTKTPHNYHNNYQFSDRVFEKKE